MTKQRLALVMGLVAAAFAVGCEKSKEDCMKDYGLIEEVASPPPGPIIIVRKVAGDTLEWKVDNTVQTTAASTAWSSQTIRKDFVGNKIMDFAVHGTDSATYTNVSYVVFQTTYGGETYFIEAIRTAGDKIRWFSTKGNERRSLTAVEGTTTEVPAEFTAPLVVSPYSFRESLYSIDIDEVNYLRVSL